MILKLSLVNGFGWFKSCYRKKLGCTRLRYYVPGNERGWEVPPELKIHNWNDIVNTL